MGGKSRFSLNEASGAEKDTFEVHFQSLRIGGEGQPILLGDFTGFDQSVKIGIEGFRAGILARVDDGGDFFVGSFLNHFSGQGINNEKLDNGHPPITLNGRHQTLADGGPQGARDLPPHADLLFRGEKFEKALDSLLGVGGVQGAEHQVACFGSRKGGRKGVFIAHFTDQDDIGVLAQNGLHAQLKGWSVDADFSLVENRFNIGVVELNGVLQGDYVLVMVMVDPVEHGGHGGAFAGAGGTANEQDAVFVAAQGRQAGAVMAELVEGWGLVLDVAEDHADGSALVEGVDAKPAQFFQGVGVVNLVFVMPQLDKRFGACGKDEFLDHGFLQGIHIDGLKVPVQSQIGRTIRPDYPFLYECRWRRFRPPDATYC